MTLEIEPARSSTLYATPGISRTHLERRRTHGDPYRQASSCASNDARESLPGIPRRGRTGQMASTERILRKGPPLGGESGRHLQDVVHELQLRAQQPFWRHLPRARAERTHLLF